MFKATIEQTKLVKALKDISGSIGKGDGETAWDASIYMKSYIDNGVGKPSGLKCRPWLVAALQCLDKIVMMIQNHCHKFGVVWSCRVNIMPRLIDARALALDTVRPVVALKMQNLANARKIAPHPWHRRKIYPRHAVDPLVDAHDIARFCSDCCPRVHIVLLYQLN